MVDLQHASPQNIKAMGRGLKNTQNKQQNLTSTVWLYHILLVITEPIPHTIPEYTHLQQQVTKLHYIHTAVFFINTLKTKS